MPLIYCNAAFMRYIRVRAGDAAAIQRGCAMWCYTARESEFLNLEQPRGELAVRALAMPADTNPSGDIFGGWIMSMMNVIPYKLFESQISDGRQRRNHRKGPGDRRFEA